MRRNTLTKKQFEEIYPDDNACLQRIFELKYAGVSVCEKCKKPFKYHKLTGLKLYSCQFCGWNIAPTADTIFHKSSTPLTDWFYSIYLFSVSKNGVSAMELQRQLGCTYKTAWRIAHRIRFLFDEVGGGLQNIVEVDETYMGGRRPFNKSGRNTEHKTPVFGMVERKGKVRAQVVVDTKRKTVMPIIREHIQIGTEVMTDNYRPYDVLGKEGYIHQTVSHDVKEYARGNVHTNTIEGFWSQLKRSINGTYHAVSPKHLQSYVNEFSFRYNHRLSSVPVFSVLVEKVAQKV